MIEDLLQQLRTGQIASKEEATRRLVAGILRERIRLESRVLTKRICDQLQADPAIRGALERLWR